MADDTSKAGESSDSAATPEEDNNAETDSGENIREKEIGGRGGPDPTRYGDWEKNGRCIDF